MEEFQTLTPDRETFLRVWKRVMPDESLSPIEIAPPSPSERQTPAAQPERQHREENIPDGQRLRELLMALEEGLSGTGEITRRIPGAYPLGDSLRQCANQVRSAYFLQTGQRWNSRPQIRFGREELRELLRRQYIWEIRWSSLCQETGGKLNSTDMREIFPDLEYASRRRRGMIRNLLART